MDHINHIKYLAKVKGRILRGIATETGHHFNTVNKYVEKNSFNLTPPTGKQ